MADISKNGRHSRAGGLTLTHLRGSTDYRSCQHLAQRSVLTQLNGSPKTSVNTAVNTVLIHPPGKNRVYLQKTGYTREIPGSASMPPVKPMLSPLTPSRFARHLASPQGSSLAPAASLCRSPAPAPPTSCTATRDAPPSRTACIRYSRRAFATTWIACHCKRARSRAVKVCRAG